MISLILKLQLAAWTVALRSCALPFTTLLWRRDRHLTWKLKEVCFGSQRPGVYPEVPISALIGRETSSRILELPSESYNVTETELLCLAAITSNVGACVVFEFGTADGRTTRNLAANVGASGRVYTLNLPLEDDSTHSQAVPIGFRFQHSPEASSIEQLWGDSRTFDFSPFYKRCQVIFIDADHSDSAVWSDSQTALRLVNDQLGVILWHDALRFGVQTALPRLMRQSGLPIHLIAGTNLAVLCMVKGEAVSPEIWAEEANAYARN